MQKTDLKDLLRTVESIRSEKYPDLDPDFLAAVVKAEDENPEDDAEATRGIEAALNSALIAKGGS